MKELLLISNSGRPFLRHCGGQILDFLGENRVVGFIGAAAFMDPKVYHGMVVEALEPLGITVEHVDLQNEPLEVLARSRAVMVGGGNTYKLLRDLHAAGVVQLLRDRIMAGMPFIGWSAGGNIAGPTILTTNDWNVVGLNRFDALNVVPFNINPHYIESDPRMAPYSETRDQRIGEYHRVQENPVVGIEEQTALWVRDDRVEVIGDGRVRLFRRDELPCDFRRGEQVPV